MADEAARGEEQEALETSLADNMDQQTPTARKRLEKRLESSDFTSTWLARIESMAGLLSAGGLANDATFLAYEILFLRPEFSIDKDLRAMLLYYFSRKNREEVLHQMKPFGCDLALGEKRAKAIYAKLKKRRSMAQMDRAR